MSRWQIALSLIAVLAACGGTMAAEPRASLADGGGLLVDGKPFLPIFVWAQPMKLIEFHKGLGINTLHAGCKDDSPRELLDKLHANGMFGWMNLDLMNDKTVGHPAVLCWTSMHEYDSPKDPLYKADLGGNATVLWIEGEQPKEHSFKQAGWLNVEKPQLSGGKWLVSSAAGEGKAVYEFAVEKPGSYNLWVREFYKTRANPTRWTLDDQAPQETPRSLGTKESKGVAPSMAVGWGKYGTVELSQGRHTLTLEVVPGQTQGGPGKEPNMKLTLWAVDALCFTTAETYPPALKGDYLPRRSPDEAQANLRKIREADPKALAALIFSGSICETFGGVPKQRVPEHTYKAFMETADIVTYDFYPSSGCNKPYRLPQNGLACRELASWAPKGKPVWAFIETGQINNTFPSPTPEEMRAQIWSCVANGAKGIGYFTVAFAPFRWTNFGEGIEGELKRSNAELTELAGPIVMGDTDRKLTVTGDEVDDKWAENRAIHAIRKEYKGKTYVIAVNVCRKAVTPTFTLAGVAAGAAAVWKEDRTVALGDGAFSDAFESLAVHVYVIE